MTVCVGLVCQGSLIVAADSQSEFERGAPVKRSRANKLWAGHGFVAAGAGIVAHIRNTVETINGEISKEIRQGRDLDKDGFYEVIERAVTALHKHYNIDRSGFLGIQQEDWFSPMILLGCHVGDTLSLFLAHAQGLVEEVDDYATIGSGAPYAELLLKTLYSDGLTLDDGINIAAYVVEEVKEIDPNCGGPVQVGVVSLEEQKILTYNEVGGRLAILRGPLDQVRLSLIPSILKGQINAKDIARMGTGHTN